MQSSSWKFYWAWPSVYFKNIQDVMFVAVIFIALLITLNCACCPMLNSIQFALQYWEQYILEGLYILPWVVSSLMLSLIHSFNHCCNVVEVIYVDRSLSVHFDKNRFLNWFGILKLIWNRTFGKNGSQPHGCEMLTRIPGIQFVCLNATGPEACSANMSSCQSQTQMTRWYM